jgi:hypothetical protein
VHQPDLESASRLRAADRAPAPAASQAEHLLKVAASVAQDASDVWADLWAEIRPQIAPNGSVDPNLQKGFTPACGWPQFLEKYWVLKHYLDSIDRISKGRP